MDLAAIGIDVHVHCLPGYEMWTLLSRRNEPWDIAIDTYGASYNDPGQFINGLATNDHFNFGHYDDPGLNRRIQAASRLSGIARAHAYAGIDLALTRDIVPRINFANPIQQDFFSARIGCHLSAGRGNGPRRPLHPAGGPAARLIACSYWRAPRQSLHGLAWTSQARRSSCKAKTGAVV